jgi:chromosome segregation ATPase
MNATHATTGLDDLLTTLEERVRRAAATVERLRAENARLARELDSAAARLGAWERHGAEWERERDALGTRLEHLVRDIDELARAHQDHEEATSSGANP